MLLQRIALPLTDIELNESGDIIMQDVNIEEMTKVELLVLALSLFSSTNIEPKKYGDIMIHDINIEEMIKAKLSILALSLFSNL